ncbi:MAG: zinc ABC transporter substrate-binding protein [Chloroflexi bacterium]|nr:zinc ABC transporter substrate-binding protein [Chloroflexota bacterium]
MSKTLTLILLTLTLALAGCAGESSSAAPAPAEEDGRLTIVTTIGQIADITQIVGGEHVQVLGLMGPGTDPHLYVASASDVDKLQNADIIFYNGLFLEAKLEDVLEQIGQNKPAVAVASGIDPSRLLASPAYVDEHDPHIWFDVTLWREAVLVVRDTLIAQDPDNRADYEANTAAYLRQLDELHAYVQAQADRLPAEQRILITAHDAFSYFGRAYGFEVRGLQGISTDAEASTADVQNLATYIAENEIRAIFVESSVPVRTIEAVQAAVRDRGWEVVIGGSLFSDAMGDAGTAEGTYLGMVRHNIDTIVGALLGE